jgi:hypothetical protein
MKMSDVNIFVSPMTIYLYKDYWRKDLNLEEFDKFVKGISQFTRDCKEVVIFFQSIDSINRLPSIEDVEKFEILTEEEIKRYWDILNLLESMKTLGITVTTFLVDLTDYLSTYITVKKKMRDIIGKHLNGRVRVNVVGNFSTGHKLGSLATYLAISDLVTSHFKKHLIGREGAHLTFKPLHAEGRYNPVDLPVMSVTVDILGIRIESGEFTVEEVRERMLKVKTCLEIIARERNYDAIKKSARRVSECLDEKSFVREFDRIFSVLKKRGFIKLEGDSVILTNRGIAHLRSLSVWSAHL